MGGKGTVLEKGKGTGKNHHKSLSMKADIYPVSSGDLKKHFKLGYGMIIFPL